MVEQIVASHLAVGVEAGEEQMAAQLDDTACVVVVGQWLSLQSCVAHPGSVSAAARLFTVVPIMSAVS